MYPAHSYNWIPEYKTNPSPMAALGHNAMALGLNDMELTYYKPVLNLVMDNN